MNEFVHTVTGWLSLPEAGLGVVFLMSLLAATILPLGSEPALLGYVALMPQAVWPAIGVATAGNTLGSVITYLMGAGAQRVLCTASDKQPGRWQRRAEGLALRFGAPVLLFSWVPLLGDPLCAVAGWLRLPFWPCLGWIALGKFARYVVICGLLLHFFVPVA